MSEVDDGGAGLGVVGLLAGLAVAVMVGFLLWNMSDRTDTSAMNVKPAVTTGNAPSAPPPPPRPDEENPRFKK
jgi:hypothetical protein